MFNRKLTFDKLSYKQANIVERVINHYQNGGTSDNSGLSPDVKDNLSKIIELADKNPNFRDKLNNVSKITFDVIKSVQQREFMSAKQEKHYLKALEILKNEFSEEESN